MDINKIGRIDAKIIELIENLGEDDLIIAGEARGLINELSNSSNVIPDVSNSVCETCNGKGYYSNYCESGGQSLPIKCDCQTDC